ncbi:MAG: hypothetical protein R2792_19345 [Saprospiraceae bacterium]
MKRVVEELIENGEASVDTQYHINRDEYPTGDFKYVIIQEFLSRENELPLREQLIMSLYLAVKSVTASPQNWFGLDPGSVELEEVPLVLQPVQDLQLKRNR